MRRASQFGATLIETLVTIVILSLGLLALSALMSHAVALPKLSSHRVAAVNIASAHAEKIRANVVAFYAGDYERGLGYDGSFANVAVRSCDYPDCTAADIAVMDTDESNALARRELPAGGTLVLCELTGCPVESHANVWVIWQEPLLAANIGGADADVCPAEVTTRFTNPAPRCVYVRFKP